MRIADYEESRLSSIGNSQSAIRNSRLIANCQSQIPNCQERGSSSIRNPQSAIRNFAGLNFLTEHIPLAQQLLSQGASRDRVWLELDPASQPPGLVGKLTAAAEALGIPLVASGRALMIDAEDRAVAAVLAAIRLGKTVESLDEADLPPAGAILRDVATLQKQLADWPQALENNQRLAEQLNFKLLPQRPVFPDFDCPQDITPRRHLENLCEKGVIWRYGKITPAVRARLDKELQIIEGKEFCEYFLVVRDIVEFARRQNAPTAGRGSGASSLVAYVLGITNICPLEFNIPFERFLHENREDFPDLDLDFCWRIRDDVINYAFDRWGADHAAMVCTHNTFQPRSAFRETAKAYGLSDDQISRLMRNPSPLGEGGRAYSAEAAASAAKAGRPGEGNSSPLKGEEGRRQGEGVRLAQIAKISQHLIGLPHLLSVHPGGIVIGRKPIDHYVPLEMAAKGVRITQYDKDGVEAIGLVKLDLLGNRSISTITEACRWINATECLQSAIRNPQSAIPRVSLDTMPSDDEETFELLRRADTVGCNQLESPAMRHLLRAMQPKNAVDIMKALALVRPARPPSA